MKHGVTGLVVVSALWLGGALWQLRLASAVLGTLAIVAAYAVGRAAFSARTGAWAAAVLAGAHPMVLRSAELLSDLPAMAGVLGGIEPRRRQRDVHRPRHLALRPGDGRRRATEQQTD